MQLTSYLAKVSIFSLTLLSLSAKAGQVCPVGYQDGNQRTEDYVYVTFKGQNYKCETTRYGDDISTQPNASCGNGIRLGNPSTMRVYINSLEGVPIEFSGNDANQEKTKDCSAGSYCINKTISVNYAKSDYASFSVPITRVFLLKTDCRKISF